MEIAAVAIAAGVVVGSVTCFLVRVAFTVVVGVVVVGAAMTVGIAAADVVLALALVVAVAAAITVVSALSPSAPFSFFVRVTMDGTATAPSTPASGLGLGEINTTRGDLTAALGFLARLAAVVVVVPWSSGGGEAER